MPLIRKRQQDVPAPVVCIAAERFDYASFANKSINITHDQFSRGKWSVDGMSSEELFNTLAANLTELIKDMKVGRIVDDLGGQYEKIQIPLSNKTEQLELGIIFTELHYYYHLKNYCITLM